MLRALAVLSVGVAALAAAWLVHHVFAVAPFRVALTHHALDVAVRTPLRLLHISDLHSGGLHARERSVLRMVEETRPDVIVVTGDSVTSGARCRAAGEVLDRLEAPLGVWVVPGNWEYWQAASQGEHCLCPTERARCLRNASARLRDDVWVVGLDDLMEGRPSVDAAFADVPDGAFPIVLAHEPTLVGRLKRPALVLSGHTHGGQICLPLVGPLFLPPESGEYTSGWYRPAGHHLYVSRGVGTSIVPARLGCEPEVALIALRPRE